MVLNPLKQFGRWRRSRGFGVHSPWAYSVIEEVLHANKRYGYYAWPSINAAFGKKRRLARKVFALIVHLQPSSVTVAGNPMWAALAATACDAPGRHGRMLLICEPEGVSADVDEYEFVVVTCLDQKAGRRLWTSMCRDGGLAIDTHRHLGILCRRPDLPTQTLHLRTAFPSQ